jgi:hypothetical protein
MRLNKNVILNAIDYRMKYCVLIIAIGDVHYKADSKEVLTHYFNKHNIPYVFLEEEPAELNYKKAHPSWLKMICHRILPDYDSIICWDLDLLPAEPDTEVMQDFDMTKLCLAFDSSAEKIYLPFCPDFKYNGGLICIPKSFRHITELVYDTFAPGNLSSFEQFYLNNIISESEVPIHELPRDINVFFGWPGFNTARLQHYTNGDNAKHYIYLHRDYYFSKVKGSINSIKYEMPSIYIELHSGLGNHIFQYALAIALRDNLGFKTYILPSRGNTHSKTNYQNLFTLVAHAVDETVPKNAVTINKKLEAFALWDLKSLEVFRNVRLSGYYQNYQLFKSAVPSIAKELPPIFDKMYGVPTWNPMSTGFIHVRRGDYMLPHTKMYNLQMEYYNNAIDHIQCMNPGLRWIIVSDDIPWCKAQTWKTIYEPTFFDSSDELKVFWCILNCKAGAVIANSTFSYWAALLSAHQVKSPVVCPRAWHLHEDIDLYPDDWILMGSKEKSLKI